MKIENVIATKGRGVFMLPPEAPLSEALHVMAANNIGAVIAVDDQSHPIGVLSERDVIRSADSGNLSPSLKVGDLMTCPVITARPGDDVDSVLRTMTDRRFRHVPIVDRGELVGIVSIGDLVKAQLNEFRGTVENLELQLLEG